MYRNPLALISLGVFCVGLNPIVTKALQMHPTNVGFYRFFFGSLICLTFILLSKSRLDRKSLGDSLPYFLLAGFFFAIDIWFWNRSIMFIGAGVATLLANTQIFYNVLIGLVFKGERPSKRFYPGIISAVVGITMASFHYLQNLSGDHATGVIYGLITGASYALVTFYLHKGIERDKSLGAFPILWVSIAGTLTLFTVSIVEGSLALFPVETTPYLLLYGTLHFLGWHLISKAMGSLSLAVSSLLLLLQPVYATFFGNYFFGETLNSTTVLGLATALFGIYLASTSRQRIETPNTTEPSIIDIEDYKELGI